MLTFYGFISLRVLSTSSIPSPRIHLLCMPLNMARLPALVLLLLSLLHAYSDVLAIAIDQQQLGDPGALGSDVIDA